MRLVERAQRTAGNPEVRTRNIPSEADGSCQTRAPIGHSAHARKKQSKAMKLHDMAKRRWLARPTSSWPTEQVYREEVQPRLSTVRIATIASTLGISEPCAAEIRAGRYRPHPRHWALLARLIGMDPRVQEPLPTPSANKRDGNDA